MLSRSRHDAVAVVGPVDQLAAALAAGRRPLDRRVHAAAPADAPRGEPPQEHVLGHHDVDHHQRARAAHHRRRARRPAPPCAETRRARTRPGVRPRQPIPDDRRSSRRRRPALPRPSSSWRCSPAACRSAPLRAGCRPSRSWAGRGFARTARTACPCPPPEGRASRRSAPSPDAEPPIGPAVRECGSSS